MKINDLFNNILYSLDIKKCRKLGLAPDSIPFLFLWVTNRCNLQCKVCDQWKAEESNSQELREGAHRCTSNCWDTTHTEWNIRCSIKDLVWESGQILNDIDYYLK